MLSAKEKLVEELRKVLDFKGEPYEGFQRIATFIIEDRKRIVTPLVEEMNRETRHEAYESNYAYMAIKQTLQNALGEDA